MKTVVLLTLLSIGIVCAIPLNAQVILKLKGTKDTLTITSHVMQLIEHLGIFEKVHITIAFTHDMPENTEGMTFSIQSAQPEAYHILKVWIDAHLKPERQKMILAHEMIHVKQYVKGEIIVIDKDHINWKGNIYQYEDSKSLRYSPWEHEAYRNDQILANLCTDQPGAPLMAIGKKQ